MAVAKVQEGRITETGTLGVLFTKLAGIRLTILLCILLAFVCLIGTLIPQRLSEVQYADSYGPTGAGIIASLGLSDIYHSLGFVGLLCLLAVNLLACSAKRFPKVWRATRRERPVPADREFRKWKCRETFVLSQASEDLEEKLEGLLSMAFRKKPKQRVGSTKERVFCIERGRYARYGPYVAHVGILVILLGGVLGILFGFKGTMILPEGQETAAAWVSEKGESIPLGFGIRCKRFVLLQYANGTPREYRSEVSLLDGEGASLQDAEIRVNHPLKYRGITFYQSTYGKIFETNLKVTDQESGQEIDVAAELNRPFFLPGDKKVRAMAVAFQENLEIPTEMQRRTSFASTRLGPAVRLVTLDDRGFGRPFWVLKDFSGASHNRQGPYRFRLEGYRSNYYTGLQAVRDPGTPLVWGGCILLIAGFLMALLMDHEILWVSSRREGDGRVVLCLAGRAVRHPTVYSARFERQRTRLRRAIRPWLQP